MNGRDVFVTNEGAILERRAALASRFRITGMSSSKAVAAVGKELGARNGLGVCPNHRGGRFRESGGFSRGLRRACEGPVWVKSRHCDWRLQCPLWGV